MYTYVHECTSMTSMSTTEQYQYMGNCVFLSQSRIAFTIFNLHTELKILNLNLNNEASAPHPHFY